MYITCCWLRRKRLELCLNPWAVANGLDGIVSWTVRSCHSPCCAYASRLPEGTPKVDCGEAEIVIKYSTSLWCLAVALEVHRTIG